MANTMTTIRSSGPAQAPSPGTAEAPTTLLILSLPLILFLLLIRFLLLIPPSTEPNGPGRTADLASVLAEILQSVGWTEMVLLLGLGILGSLVYRSTHGILRTHLRQYNRRINTPSLRPRPDINAESGPAGACSPSSASSLSSASSVS
ncbi:uncharacterized protein N7459_005634 [Penicillium hispanicum]|uniref:uncharacterized protein n=1 Tax=Penicillium hispanicum TaxID=1080232 RepID=UPI0025418FF4|nr:uncharacterized protein N7459_005634 [Penicillium hispanicum]KAJ5579649.1 hypothetical protein N7459_005634 [Penicillium hispanicum]